MMGPLWAVEPAEGRVRQSSEQAERKGDYRPEPPVPQMHPEGSDGYYYTDRDGMAEAVERPYDFAAGEPRGLSPEAAQALVMTLVFAGLLALGWLAGWLFAAQRRIARRELIYTEIRKKAVAARNAADHRRIDHLFDLFDTVRKQFGADKNGHGGMMTLGAVWGDLDGRFAKLLNEERKHVWAKEKPSQHERTFTEVRKVLPHAEPNDAVPAAEQSVAAASKKVAEDAYAFWVEEDVKDGKATKKIDKRPERLADIRVLQKALLG
jgi:hypothetical protein